MFKIVLLLCFCMVSICTDAHKKACVQLLNKPNPGVVLQEIDLVYPFMFFKK